MRQLEYSLDAAKKLMSQRKNGRKVQTACGNGNAYTDGSVIKRKNDSPPLAGSGVYKSSGDTTQTSQQKLHINPMEMDLQTPSAEQN
eukprot:135681-Pelagomonas_calceolata.AAC.1